MNLNDSPATKAIAHLDDPDNQIVFVVETISSQIGTVYLFMREQTKPLWNGPYNTGMLTIYLAEIHGEPNLPIIGLIYVITDPTQTHLEGTGFAVYPQEGFTPVSAVADFLEDINAKYLAANVSEKEQAVTNGHQLH